MRIKFSFGQSLALALYIGTLIVNVGSYINNVMAVNNLLTFILINAFFLLICYALFIRAKELQGISLMLFIFIFFNSGWWFYHAVIGNFNLIGGIG